jgi:hypothetical protein
MSPGVIDTIGRAGDGTWVMRALLPFVLIPLLAACGEAEVTRPVAVVSQPAPHVTHHAPPRDAAMASVIGADADALIRQFGPPRLDIHDGDARKLQWSGTACILDAYLYPTTTGGRLAATYLDTRRGDGRDVDHTACITALRRN